VSDNIKNWKTHYGKVLDSKEKYDVIECAECKFRHIIPIPSQEELSSIYRNEYYSEDKPVFSIERFLEDIEWWQLVFRERFEKIEEFMDGKPGRILDVGSGTGHFLLEGKNRGWITKGIEPSRQALEYSKTLGLDVKDGFLTPESSHELGEFDVVHMSEVLEHIPDPLKFFGISHSLLKKDGLVCVVSPNEYNPFQNALKNIFDFKPWWVAPPHHINFFNRRSLFELLKKCGFSAVFHESTFPMEMFLLMGQNYVDDPDLGRQCHFNRKAFELNLDRANLGDLKRRMYGFFSENDIGREIMVIGRKL